MKHLYNIILITLAYAVLINSSYLRAMEHPEEDNNQTLMLKNVRASAKIIQDNQPEIFEKFDLSSYNIRGKFQKEKVENDINSLLTEDNIYRIPSIITKIEKNILNQENIKKELSFDAKNVADQLTLYKNSIKNLHITEFKGKLKQYFSSLPTLKDKILKLDFKDKVGGRQIGNRIFITLNDSSNTELIYHAKTHSGGASNNSSSADPVDPKELFIYKFLEKSGLGCEVHFFYYDIAKFYIATKDAAFVGNIKKRFKTYTEIKNSSEKLKNLISKDIEKKDEDQIDKVISNGLVQTDIISRVFRLSDLVNNSGNIGFIIDDGENTEKIESLKIIDFEVTSGTSYEDKETYKGFLSGNTIRSYKDSSDPLVRYFLAKRDDNARIQTARDIMQDGSLLFKAIDSSYEDVKLVLLRSNLFSQKDALEDLQNYKANVLENLRNFLKDLSINKII